MNALQRARIVKDQIGYLPSSDLGTLCLELSDLVLAQTQQLATLEARLTRVEQLLAQASTP